MPSIFATCCDIVRRGRTKSSGPKSVHRVVYGDKTYTVERTFKPEDLRSQADSPEVYRKILNRQDLVEAKKAQDKIDVLFGSPTHPSNTSPRLPNHNVPYHPYRTSAAVPTVPPVSRPLLTASPGLSRSRVSSNWPQQKVSRPRNQGQAHQHQSTRQQGNAKLAPSPLMATA